MTQSNGHSAIDGWAEQKGKLKTLFNSLASMKTEEIVNTLESEAFVRETFRTFLKDSGLYLSLKNFDALLAEKSGEKFRRNDATVNWYHELSPILLLLDLARRGRKDGGFDIEDLEPYGGLEVLISTHLRHDSVEDFISKEQLRKDMLRMRREILKEHLDYDPVKSRKQVEQILTNVNFMTQLRAPGIEGGKPIKETALKYMNRLVTKSDSPIPFMLKLADKAHNLAQLLFAPKFDAARRLKRCNETENQLAPREGNTDKAISRWRPFEPAIVRLDAMVGFILFPHFRWLEWVDKAYPPEREISKNVVGTGRYMTKALSFFHVPEGLNPLHIATTRFMKAAKAQTTPEKIVAGKEFLEEIFYPAIEPHRQHFDYIDFNGSKPRSDIA